MKIITMLIITLVVGALAVVGFANSGLYDVSAASPHSGIVDWLLSTTSHASVERRAKGIMVRDLDDDAMALAGVNDFDAMCTGCHGAPGQEPDAMGQGLNPPAPDLAVSAAEMTSAELFWVTKHGIRMTGMPAWGVTHDDDAIWPVVALLTRLPDLDEAGYQSLLASAEGQGHHADEASVGGHSHEEGDEAAGSAGHHEDAGPSTEDGEASQPDVMPDAAEEHDHSTHEHDG